MEHIPMEARLSLAKGRADPKHSSRVGSEIAAVATKW